MRRIKSSSKTATPVVIRLLEAYDYAYANKKPIISDAKYDRIRAKWHQRYPNHPYFRKVGAEPPKSKVNVKLPVPMMGLDKIRPSTVQSWVNQYSPDYVILSAKRDGLAVLLYYADGIFEKAFSRGTDSIGQDITRHVRGVVPKVLQYDHTKAGGEYLKLINPTKGDVLIRGEITIPKDKFDIYNEAHPGKYKNPRVMVNGLLNRDEPSSLNSMLEFGAHEMAFPSLSDPCLEFVHFNVFNIPHVGYYKFTPAELTEKLVKRKIKFFKEQNHPCDGVVLACARGKLNGANISRIAVKLETFDQPYVETTVTKITWRLSDRGLLKPTIHIDPVTIDGFTNNTSTGNNAKEIASLRLGAGSKIRLVRAGDVIPHILKDEANKPTPVNKLNIPKKCPQCGTALIYTRTIKGEEGVDLYCPDSDCANTRRTATFLSRLDPDGIGDEIVAQLAEALTVRQVFLTKQEILCATFGKVKGPQIYSALRKAMNCSLEKIMYASGCFSSPTISLGIETITSILNQITNGPKPYTVTLAELTDTETASNTYTDRIRMIVKPSAALDIFLNNIGVFRQFYSTIEKWHKMPAQSTSLKGMVFCFTGFRHGEAIDTIRNNGGGYRSSLTKDVTHLIYSSKDSSKYAKAKSLGLTCWSPQRMMEFLGLWQPKPK